MSINMIELKHLVQKRQSGKEYIGLPFGSAIRYLRKELRITLEEASKGICSLSYLSKVENQNISASDEFIEKFKKKYDMKDAYDYDKDNFKEQIEYIIDACLKDHKIDRKMVMYYDDRVDYQSLLVEFAYEVLNNNYDKAELSYKNLVQLISSMPQEAFMITMILVNHILYYEMRYSDGLSLLDIIEKQDPYSNEIALLIKKWKLKHGFQINNAMLVSTIYQPYEKELIKKHLFEQVKSTNVHKLMYQSRFISCKRMKSEISGINDLSETDKHYLIAKCHFHSGDYEKALAISSKYYNQSVQWMALHLLALDHLKHVDPIFKILDETKDYEHPLYKLLSKHLTIKYKAKQEEIVNYIKKDILVHNLITEDYDILIYLMRDCERLLSKFQYYKDAVSVYRHFLSKLYKNSYA